MPRETGSDRYTSPVSDRSGKEQGASVIELALVLPLLVALLFGIIEFGWTLAQNLEVKHIAREVGRLASVDDPEGLIDERACSAIAASIQSVTVAGSTNAGGTVTVTATGTHVQLTGLFDWAFSGFTTLTSEVEVRLEQDLTSWTGTSC